MLNIPTYWHKNPRWLAKLYPGYEWYVPTNEQFIYLTFDDGPVPGPTEFVLDVLKEYGAKATFFVVGHNVVKYPHIMQRVLDEGHRVGNHTFNHLNGWKTPLPLYLDNVAKCQEAVLQHVKNERVTLFRPPYGRVQVAQAKVLRADYRLVMWDVLTGDFDRTLDKEVCLRKSVEATQPGSIVVFHDSVKAAGNMEWVLPRFMERFKDWKFERLGQGNGAQK